ncbi:MFS transporter [Metallosphaera tengchongensis]|uniref:MFS transporter n=1 Tax=Metallosphaera tengchongensis TaxID=1532350 RepID=A0A6N0NUG1_9CREN|nr:MFS transporter [Metallosphaera tengchongensis]QKQ99766.1 MFS transporter [Metallosphaera tengchongensis]
MIKKDNFFYLSISTSLSTFGNSLWIFYLPLIFLKIGVDVTLQGIIYSIATILGIILSPVSGILVDKYSARLVLFSFTTLASLLNLILYFGITYNLRDFLLACVILYLGLIPPFISVASKVILAESKRPAQAYGLFLSIASTPSIIGPFLGSFLISNGLSLLISSFINVVSAALRLKVSEVKGNSIDQRGIISALMQLKQKRLMILSISLGLFSLIASPDSYILIIYSVDHLGFGKTTLGIFYSVQTLLYTVVPPLIGRIASRKILVLAYILEGISFYLLTVTGSTDVGFMTMTLLVFSAIAWEVSFFGEVAKIGGRGVKFGILSGISSSSTAITLAFSGYLYQISSTLLFYSYVLLILFSLLAYIIALYKGS